MYYTIETYFLVLLLLMIIQIVVSGDVFEEDQNDVKKRVMWPELKMKSTANTLNYND